MEEETEGPDRLGTEPTVRNRDKTPGEVSILLTALFVN